jgi:hypothetical protein
VGVVDEKGAVVDGAGRVLVAADVVEQVGERGVGHLRRAHVAADAVVDVALGGAVAGAGVFGQFPENVGGGDGHEGLELGGDRRFALEVDVAETAGEGLGE